MKKKRILSMAVLLAMILQILAPTNIVFADVSQVPANQIAVTNCTFIIKDSSNATINPTTDASGNVVYSDVPKDAKIDVQYAFNLRDNNGLDSSDPAYIEYEYTSEQAISLEMPTGVDFSSTVPVGGMEVTASDGSTMGTLKMQGTTAVLSFAGYDYVEKHYSMGGSFNISGCFNSSVKSNPKPAPITFVFNGTTYKINVKEDSNAFSSEVLSKSVVTGYNYSTRRTKWKIIVNKNKIPLTNAVISDTMPEGMKLVTGSFDVVNESNAHVTSSVGVLEYVNSGDDDILTRDSFKYTFSGIADSKTYTITYETEMKDKYLKENQFVAPKGFLNTAEITASNYANTVSSSASQTIKNPIIEKKYSYVKGADTIDWIVPINIAHCSWAEGLEITDDLQNDLELDIHTIKLYYMNVNPDGTLTKSTLVPKTEYDLGYKDKKLTVSIKGSITSAYQLEFTTDVLTDATNVNNSVLLKGSSIIIQSIPSKVIVNVNDVTSIFFGKQGELIISKVDSADGITSLSGAVFQLYDIRKIPILGKIGTTDANGRLVFDSLALRTYYIGEITAPDGYVADKELNKVSIDPITLQRDITFGNQKALGDIEFLKQNESAQPLAGAEFTLYKKGSSTALNTSISDASGKVVFKNIGTGEYEIKETKAPNGYQISTDIVNVKVEIENNSVNAKVSLSKNIIKGEKAAPIVTHTVTFDSNGGSTIMPVIDVTSGSTITLPTPIRPDYIFKGWFEGTIKYTSTTPITKEVTLVAKWEKITQGGSNTGSSGGNGNNTAKPLLTIEQIINQLSQKDKEAILQNFKEHMPYTSLNTVLTIERLREFTNNMLTDKQLQELLDKPQLFEKLGIEQAMLSSTIVLKPIKNASFIDVPQTHWANGAVKAAAELGLAAGMSDGSFEPNTPLQTSDTFTFLDRVLLLHGRMEMKLSRSTVEKYVTDKSHWAFLPMASIGSKLSEETLKSVCVLGDKPLSRELLAQILYELTEGKLKPVKEAADFEDIADSPYKEAISYCVREGLLNGIDSKHMAPKKALTRAELMSVLIRLDEKLK